MPDHGNEFNNGQCNLLDVRACLLRLASSWDLMVHAVLNGASSDLGFSEGRNLLRGVQKGF